MPIIIYKHSYTVKKEATKGLHLLRDYLIQKIPDKIKRCTAKIKNMNQEYSIIKLSK